MITSSIALLKIKTIVSRRRFLDVITEPVDDISGAIGIVHDTQRLDPTPVVVKVCGCRP
jgi:hypothetical protein